MDSRIKENPERTFDVVLQVACPTSENEDPTVLWSFPQDLTDQAVASSSQQSPGRLRAQSSEQGLFVLGRYSHLLSVMTFVGRGIASGGQTKEDGQRKKKGGRSRKPSAECCSDNRSIRMSLTCCDW
ncbi:DENN domain-containing protein 1B isoform X1 [Lates japonicus]|uniref:DENN domain-containing protein 1B isoform X1 n=1 Tax=Lates japonicus TaxID=270547 RepID=A0AAD3M8M9_LATJO|nr:DENN domain-containing protein 1B isoform X1 [Lates japonicus]